MEHIFKIEMGDPGGDGHDKSDEYFYQSNYPLSEIQKAYEKSCKKTGVDLHNSCSEYEDSTIDESVIEALESAGMDIKKIIPDAEYVNIDNFSSLIIEFVRLSMPKDFKCERTMNKIKSLGNFGYGLYC
jgi:hypothetical protein